MIIINELIPKMERCEGKLVAFHNRKRIEMSFSSLFTEVINASFYFKQRGLGSQDIVGIIGKNELEWIIADLACIACGIKIFPLEIDSDFSCYQSNNFVFSTILIGSEYREQMLGRNLQGFNYIFLDEITLRPAPVDKQFASYEYEPKEVFSYKSTSGSTGVPKIIGHSVESLTNSLINIQRLFNHTAEDRILVFLPLNILQQRYWLYSAIIYNYNIIIIPKEYFFLSLSQEKPTVIMGVPYIFEVIYDVFMEKLKGDNTFRDNYNDYLLSGDKCEYFAPLKEYFGGSIRYLWTGSAPISRHIVEFFFNVGLPLYQGYGMNETCIIAKNYYNNNKIGSVGKIFPNVEVKFDYDHQILVRNTFPVCETYVSAPDHEKRSTFKSDGFIATGDLGYMDDDGYLYINGRIKDMIALSNSKKIFPRFIEEKIESHSEIEHCVVFGDNKPYLVAIIVPSSKEIKYEDLQMIIDKFNSSANAEHTIYKYYVTMDRFSVHNNLLSNQNKIKRQAIYKQYYSHLEDLYK